MHTYESWRITYQSAEQAARAAYQEWQRAIACKGCPVQQGTHVPMGTVVHPDDLAVDALAAAMKAKLARQRAKGYGGWDTDCTQQRLSDLLRGHVDKGDPVDVANFCAFLLARGEGIAAAPQAVQAAVPLPLLVRDIARDLGITVPQACIALKPLGNYSTNSAVTAEMARMLHYHFPTPAHPAGGAPATDSLLFQCGKAAGRQEVLDEQTGPDFWEWVRRAYRNPESTSFTVHNMAVAYRAGLAAIQPAAQGMEQDAARYRWLVDCNRVPWLQFLDFAPGNDVDAAIDAAIAAEEEKRTQ